MLVEITRQENYGTKAAHQRLLSESGGGSLHGSSHRPFLRQASMADASNAKRDLVVTWHAPHFESKSSTTKAWSCMSTGHCVGHIMLKPWTSKYGVHVHARRSNVSFTRLLFAPEMTCALSMKLRTSSVTAAKRHEEIRRQTSLGAGASDTDAPMATRKLSRERATVLETSPGDMPDKSPRFTMIRGVAITSARYRNATSGKAK
mmetsp:Transcript_50890/g.142414  ORF Transcript_50890/g.142414 Transcript_50890/m.142414 type:complete len:204 (-) Transcript_50890:65-676(-)